jgi:surface antigen
MPPIKRSKHFAPVVLLALLLAGCYTTGGPGPKATLGGMGGAAVGGLLAAGAGGNAPVIAGATILGGLLGAAIGDHLDAVDRQRAYETAQYALETAPTGSSSTWQNPDSGNYGTFTPTDTYRTTSGQYCREYEQTIYIDGSPRQAYGTACRLPDGTWRIVNS